MIDVVWAGMRCLHGPEPSVSVLICGYPHSWKRKPDWVARRGCIAIGGVTIPRDTRLSMRGLRAPSAFRAQTAHRDPHFWQVVIGVGADISATGRRW
jgi:hypothetical protein